VWCDDGALPKEDETELTDGDRDNNGLTHGSITVESRVTRCVLGRPLK
jgi:hypothetical protein